MKEKIGDPMRILSKTRLEAARLAKQYAQQFAL
jgi:hypothetical protein